jgi:DNA-binding NtrC family response regulator
MKHKLNIILADDEDIVLRTVGKYLCKSGHNVDEASDGLAALKLIEQNDYDLGLIDVKMPKIDGISLLAKVNEIRPKMSIAIITGHGDMKTAIEALKLGAADFMTKPIKFLELDAVLERIARFSELRHNAHRLRETIKTIQSSSTLRPENRTLVGASPAMLKVREQIRQAVESGCDTILITGETGTGKEVVARSIHFQANSDESPFIAVSCPSLPETLIESELFGHVKGAFTGATEDKAGCFELADGGTLLLDEVADLSATAQASLLRVLETRKLRRVGSSKEISVKVRVIAATNTPIKELIEEGEFRQDLFYRLDVYSIHLPPLRKRRGDILPLAEYFLKTYAKARKIDYEGFSEEANNLLLNYDFPGNARELRNIVERAAILCKSGIIHPEHLSIPKSPAREENFPQAFQSEEDKERARIKEALEETKWNRREAAEKLGMGYSTLRYKIKVLGIK